MNRRRALLLMLSASAISGCAGRDLHTGALDRAPAGPYTLDSGDRLRVIVFGQDSLSNIYAVDGAGSISMPLIGPVKVASLSTDKAARLIEARLREGFIREPRVTVEVDAYRPFFILGEVVNSGQYAFVSGMTVQTAVAIASGFSPRATRTSAELSRKVGDAIVTGSVPINHPVRPGDTIVIKERWF